MNKYLTTFFIAFITLFGVSTLPSILFAQTVSLQTAASIHKPGEQFQVEVTLNTEGKSINTLSGTINIPTAFSVSDIRYGNSVITLWVENPAVDGANIIHFAGGTPGGYVGSNGEIFSFVVSAKQEGSFSLTQENTKLLLNDGNGTQVPTTAKNLSLKISSTGTSTNFESHKDTTPPEQFNPVVTHDKNVVDDNYFASFLAVDKDSGVAHYDITEIPLLLPWFKVSSTTNQSTYILTNQFLPEKVSIKAYDRAGNMTEGTVMKPGSMFFYILLFLILLIILFICIRWATRRRKV